MDVAVPCIFCGDDEDSRCSAGGKILYPVCGDESVLALRKTNIEYGKSNIKVIRMIVRFIV